MADTAAKHVFLTGCTSGIGAAFLKFAAESGRYSVSALSRRPVHSDVIVWNGLSDLDNLDLLEQTLQDFSAPLDGIVLFAGELPGRTMFESTPAQMEHLFRVNVIANMVIIKALAPCLAEDSAVVLLGSISGFKGSHDDPYAATKGAIHSLVKSLALKMAPRTRVVGIAPGMTNDTRMTDDLVDGLYQRTLSTIPLRRAAEASEIAALVDTLLGASARSITGAVLDVNGGQYLR
ncbi:SDR family oxidoreductase [Breoghania sp. L-A4]|uniref:SDR family NAD(P)-dependent oxidoreductase n=1 Tax=Breoghania sp. L-A4 TaxID=2304600 RepID=UPI0013C3712D|nr:SDR family oxidoreductase [Breoghania sp. L-A4]